MKKTILALLLIVPFFTYSQSGSIKGKVSDVLTNEAISFADVILVEQNIGTITNDQGEFVFEDLAPGLYNVRVSLIGYETYTEAEVEVIPPQQKFLTISLGESSTLLNEVEVSTQSSFNRNSENISSLQSIGINEIQRNPGSNQDVSKVVTALPGVAFNPSASRNDLIVRGGGPNENRFYLDGIEIPNINHFATQGASGGPQGIINANLVRDVDFYTGAFPAARGNMLSSLMNISLKDGNSDKFQFTGQASVTEAGITMDGPFSKNSNASYLVSVRRSYLSVLFDLIGLPFLPTYNDVTAKIKVPINEKNIITFIGLGAYDVLDLNLDANEDDYQRFLLNNIPTQTQWSYSTGVKYDHFGNKGKFTAVLSRFELYNGSDKYVNNDREAQKVLDYLSKEAENKLRLEYKTKLGNVSFLGGLGLETAKYHTETFSSQVPGAPLSYDSDLNLFKYALFAEANWSSPNDRWKVNAGLRTDAADYNSATNNPLKQLSPRVSVSFGVNEALSINANYGLYYQLPAYTVLGYKEGEEFVNRNNGIGYMGSQHFVLGASYFTEFNGKFNVDGFYKTYRNTPFAILRRSPTQNDTIPLANLGADFGVVGNKQALPGAEGRAYGMELSYQQKFYKGFYGIAAYTLVRSLYDDINGQERPSSWDSQHLVSITGGKRFNKGWEMGLRWQFTGGSPFTPYDVVNSTRKSTWDQQQSGILDYSQLNSQRLDTFNQLNLRVDKKIYLKGWTLNFYLDVQNALASSIDGQPILEVERDASGNPVTLLDERGQPVLTPDGEERYAPNFLDDSLGTVIPSLGVIVSF